MSIVIRVGVATDATALAELAARTFRETFAADNWAEDMALHAAVAYGTSQQQRELIDPDIVTLLVEVEGQLAGYAQLRWGVSPACVTGTKPVELWRFYIAQLWHGRGVAQALMRSVESEAYRRGSRTLWLGVWERNERAKAFYHKTGFIDVGSHVFMVGTDPQTDRILVRSLPTVMSNVGQMQRERSTRPNAPRPPEFAVNFRSLPVYSASVSFNGRHSLLLSRMIRPLGRLVIAWLEWRQKRARPLKR